MRQGIDGSSVDVPATNHAARNEDEVRYIHVIGHKLDMMVTIITHAFT